MSPQALARQPATDPAPPAPAPLLFEGRFLADPVLPATETALKAWPCRERKGPPPRGHDLPKLETTFRCSARIARVATQFVPKNPAQIEKTVRSGREGGGPGVFVWLRGKKNENLLEQALQRIAADAGKEEGDVDVLVLSRYRRPRPKDLEKLAGRDEGLPVSFKTVHASKGLEADYVVVLALCTGRNAFPVGMTDDPVLDLVLAEQERLANAEERRLLYVPFTEAAAPGVPAGGSRRAFLVRPGADGGLRGGDDRRGGDGNRDVSSVSRGAAAASREQGARRGVLRLLELALLRIRAAPHAVPAETG